MSVEPSMEAAVVGTADESEATAAAVLASRMASSSSPPPPENETSEKESKTTTVARPETEKQSSPPPSTEKEAREQEPKTTAVARSENETHSSSGNKSDSENANKPKTHPRDNQGSEDPLKSNTVLNYGYPLPPLSAASRVRFPLKSKLKHCKTHFTEADVPTVLHNLDAPEWKDGKFLQETFQIKSEYREKVRKKVSPQYPLCLILDTKTLVDRCIMLNYWASLPNETRRSLLDWQKKGGLKDYYIRPRFSNDPWHGQIQLKSCSHSLADVRHGKCTRCSDAERARQEARASETPEQAAYRVFLEQKEARKEKKRLQREAEKEERAKQKRQKQEEREAKRFEKYIRAEERNLKRIEKDLPHMWEALKKVKSDSARAVLRGWLRENDDDLIARQWDDTASPVAVAAAAAPEQPPAAPQEQAVAPPAPAQEEDVSQQLDAHYPAHWL